MALQDGFIDKRGVFSVKPYIYVFQFIFGGIILKTC